MLSKLFLGISLVGAEWVLYFLVLVSILSVALVIERLMFYYQATQGLATFRGKIRSLALEGNWGDAQKLARTRVEERNTIGNVQDLEADMALALLDHYQRAGQQVTLGGLAEIAQDAMTRSRLGWDRNLSILATIGSNAPFVGLFGTVLGIMKAFHDLSQQVGGAQTVTAGISEALVATAVGLLVAIPAVIAFNLFQRKVKAARLEAEALRGFLMGCLTSTKGQGGLEKK